MLIVSVLVRITLCECRLFVGLGDIAALDGVGCKRASPPKGVSCASARLRVRVRTSSVRVQRGVRSHGAIWITKSVRCPSKQIGISRAKNETRPENRFRLGDIAWRGCIAARISIAREWAPRKNGPGSKNGRYIFPSSSKGSCRVVPRTPRRTTKRPAKLRRASSTTRRRRARSTKPRRKARSKSKLR